MDAGSEIICRFFLKGECFYGQNCMYSHGTTTSQGARAVCSSSSNRYPSSKFGPRSVLKEETKGLSLSQLSLESGKSRQGHGTRIQSSWINAPEFVPKGTSQAASSSSPMQEESTSKAIRSWAVIVNPEVMAELTVSDALSQLCPYQANGECRYGENCALIHGDVCEMCSKAILHPNHEQQRKEHQKQCLQEHEMAMEAAFSFEKSKEKTCGICMEVVVEKAKGENRFGILPSCNHCFCLPCLRKWRQAKFENKIIRSCPECRQTSNFICPSWYWVETTEEKEKLLSGYKEACKTQHCKHYQRGDKACPFGNQCFYKHVNKAGQEVDVGPPTRKVRRENADGELLNEHLFYDFLEQREAFAMELLDLVDWSDSDSEDMFDDQWHLSF